KHQPVAHTFNQALDGIRLIAGWQIRLIKLKRAIGISYEATFGHARLIPCVQPDIVALSVHTDKARHHLTAILTFRFSHLYRYPSSNEFHTCRARYGAPRPYPGSDRTVQRRYSGR